MKCRIFAAMCVLICFLLGGCGFWMDGEYLSVTPHEEQNLHVVSGVIEVSNYVQLRNAIAELIESGADGGTISVSSFNSTTAHHYANVAVNYVMDSNPIAAYAVKEITFEVETGRGATVIAFDIAYRHGRSEILQIKKTGSLDDVRAVITSTLDNCEDSVVLRINQYNAVDIVQLIQDHAYANPDRVMEVPQVQADIYPEEGKDRVIA